jgi:hypothetical protein
MIEKDIFPLSADAIVERRQGVSRLHVGGEIHQSTIEDRYWTRVINERKTDEE